MRDISLQKRAEKELDTYRDHLEELITERTRELAHANLKLKFEVDDRKQVRKALFIREKELQAQSQHLEEVNS